MMIEVGAAIVPEDPHRGAAGDLTASTVTEQIG